MFPLKDNIPLPRFPIVTVALVAINVIVCLLEILQRCSVYRGPTDSVETGQSRTSSRTPFAGLL